MTDTKSSKVTIARQQQPSRLLMIYRNTDSVDRVEWNGYGIELSGGGWMRCNLVSGYMIPSCKISTLLGVFIYQATNWLHSSRQFVSHVREQLAALTGPGMCSVLIRLEPLSVRHTH